MFVYLFFTLPVLLFFWLAYSSRNFLLTLGRWALARRYEVVVRKDFEFDPKKDYLIIPNHPAAVDPLLLVTELHHLGLDVCPLVDESFFTIRLVRHTLSLFDAIRVPDVRHENFWPRPRSYHYSRSSAVRRAKALGYSVLALLTAGENVLLYPSGHITEDGTENIGNRRLTYNVVTQLPQNVEIVLVRIRGLYGSIFSRAGLTHSPHYLLTPVKAIFLWPFCLLRRRRRVHIYAEIATAQVAEWSKGTRQEFDTALEHWYDADLAMLGIKTELPT